MNFEVLIDSSLVDLGMADSVVPSTNKRLLSIINDFEDGKWRHEKFDNFIWDNVAETALTFKERQAMLHQPHSMLMESAKNLRLTDADNDIGKGSELAEIVLYGIMRHQYKALPVVPKIFYKQNAQDNAKGADSVHIIIATDGEFSLCFGEAKFYNSIEDARLSDIITSVRNALDTAKLKKENAIITNLSELDQLGIDPELLKVIKDALDNKESIDDLKPRIIVPILLLHQCEMTANARECSADYLASLRSFHQERAESYFKKQIKSLRNIFKYAAIRFHLILFPVPVKEPIVDKFVTRVQHYKS